MKLVCTEEKGIKKELDGVLALVEESTNPWKSCGHRASLMSSSFQRRTPNPEPRTICLGRVITKAWKVSKMRGESGNKRRIGKHDPCLQEKKKMYCDAFLDPETRGMKVRAVESDEEPTLLSERF